MTTASQAWAFVIDAGAAGDVLSDTHGLANELHLVHGLSTGASLVVTETVRTAGATIEQAILLTGDVVTVTRQ